MESPKSCPVCASATKIVHADVRDYFVRRGESAAFSIHFCPDCRCAHTEPPMSDKQLEEYYPKDYSPHVVQKGLIARLQSGAYSRDLQRLRKHGLHETGSLFEIGAGRGEFLAAAAKKGFKVAGTEPSEQARKVAFEQWGVSLDPGFVSEA